MEHWKKVTLTIFFANLSKYLANEFLSIHRTSTIANNLTMDSMSRYKKIFSHKHSPVIASFSGVKSYKRQNLAFFEKITLVYRLMHDLYLTKNVDVLLLKIYYNTT